MIHAYDKLYLERARTALARMLDVGVNDNGLSLPDFYQLFLESTVAERFQEGDYEMLVGHSGAELAWKVLESSYGPFEYKTPQPALDRSEEYWTGWALAYYQWRTALTFAEIQSVVPIEDIRAMYMPYHEMDISHFCEAMDGFYRNAYPETNLKRLRVAAGLSQQQLADAVGTSVRTIQQYEQRQKNINRAAAETVFQMARILYCSPERLLEKVEG